MSIQKAFPSYILPPAPPEHRIDPSTITTSFTKASFKDIQVNPFAFSRQSSVTEIVDVVSYVGDVLKSQGSKDKYAEVLKAGANAECILSLEWEALITTARK